MIAQPRRREGDAAGGAPGGAAAWPSPGSAWYTAALLCGAYIFSYVDRQVINVLAPNIKADLGLTDVELSYLQGMAFVFPYVSVGLVCGALVDRRRRTWLVVGGMAVWSLLTAACGATRSFLPFFAFRSGVGIGESVLTPSAVSIISDNFPVERRQRPLALFNLGVTLGSAASYLVLAALIPRRDVTLPLLGVLRPWQTVFLMLGLPGILYAAFLLTLREPARRGIMAGQGAAQKADYAAALRFVAQRRVLFLRFIAGMTLLALMAYGPSSQTTLFYTRTFGWTVRQVAAVNGVLILCAAVPGALGGGWLAGRLRRSGHKDGTLRAIFYGSIGMVVPIVGTYLMPTAPLAWVFSGFQSFFSGATLNLGNVALSEVLPNQFRGKVVALYSMTLALLGLGLGPWIIAMLTDHVFGDEMLIRYSLATFSAVMAPLAVVAIGLTLRPFRAVAAEAEGWTGMSAG